jgi:4'-phosphopantetheinyl transferase
MVIAQPASDLVPPREWAPGPPHPQLEPGSLHVWRADLQAVADEVLGSLSTSEQWRAARFPDAARGQLWARSHGVLRALLASYLELDAAAVAFTHGRLGKPVVEPTAGGRSISFNISHSGAVALFAFGEAAVGVDVQRAPRRAINHTAIAARALGAVQARRLAKLAPAEREREFLRAWARHEAALKCRGSGIVAERPRATGDPTAASRAPWIAELELDGRSAAAVASTRAPRQLFCFCWSRAPGASRLEDAQSDRLRERLAAEAGGQRG